jgi:hypothetical protein
MPFTSTQRIAFLEAGIPPAVSVTVGRNIAGDLLGDIRDIWLLTGPQLQEAWDRERADVNDPEFWTYRPPERWYHSYLPFVLLVVRRRHALAAARVYR